VAVTPNDILEKRFERSFRGYDEDQVDEFLDAVKEELESKIEENQVLCNQIVGLEEEIHDLKLELAEKPKIANGDALSEEMVESAKQTADKYVAEAKQTAENIIIEANKKAEAAVDKASEKIKAMYTKAVIAQKSEAVSEDNDEAATDIVDSAKQQAFKMINDAKSEAESIRANASDYADRIMRETDEKSKVVFEQKVAEVNEKVDAIKEQYQKEAVERAMISAKERAKEIVEKAKEKAEQTQSMMNIQIANAQKQLEDIHIKVDKYKAKLEEFIKLQAGMLQGLDIDNSDDDSGEGLNKAAADGLTQKMAKDAEEAGGLGIEADVPETHVENEIFTRIEPQSDKDERLEETTNDISVEKLVTMASDDGDAVAVKERLNDETLAFSDEERKELEDLLDELL